MRKIIVFAMMQYALRSLRYVAIGLTIILAGCSAQDGQVGTEVTDQILLDDLVAVQSITTEDIRESIEESKGYLLRSMHPEKFGVTKRYDVETDTSEEVLHSIYSSSVLYTLLKMYNLEKDKMVLDAVRNGAEFILAMQNTYPKSSQYGAFHYSYDIKTDKREQRFVVGTTSKIIFTLLKLYELEGDEKYLEAAKNGANWLMTMVTPSGRVRASARYDDGQWKYSDKESFLYNGQVLSALSRIYGETRDPKYLDSATAIVRYFIQTVEEQGCYVGDDYREPNPISSSWVIQSLLDYYKVSNDRVAKDIVMDCSNELLGRQIKFTDDLSREGRWLRSLSTSGNGWISEVLSEVYEFCLEEGEADCDKYLESILSVIRWNMQHTYTEESPVTAFPEQALGGIMWNSDERYVRIDSVCHGVNSYVNILPHLEEGVVLSVSGE